jgi:hypothetical protein
MNVTANKRAGAVTPSRVQAYAGRTLDLLQAIEKTIDCLTDNCDVLAVLSGGLVKHLKSLEESNTQIKLDAEGRVCQLLSQCIESAERMHQTATRNREAAVFDARLCADDGVVEAYDAFISALSDHHDILHELKEWIETHDALLEPAVGETYDSVDDLFKAMLYKA